MDAPAEFGVMMDRQCGALQTDMSFRQQLDPVNGEFTRDAPPDYSPAALVMLDYTWRLAGVREEDDSLEWNVRPGHPAAQSALFRMQIDTGRTVEMKYDRTGAELRLSGKVLARVDSGMARLITDNGGVPRALIGIRQPQNVVLRLGDQAVQNIALQKNARVVLR
jgi:hypothetical protein